jgi:hypothetical protein
LDAVISAGKSVKNQAHKQEQGAGIEQRIGSGEP